MEKFLLWFLGIISDFASFLLSIKIIGNFSFWHFILSGWIIIWIFKFVGFGYGNSIDSVNSSFISMRNNENRKDRQRYYSEKTNYYHEKSKAWKSYNSK